MTYKNEYDEKIETIISISNDILDAEDPGIKDRLAEAIDEKITHLNMAIAKSYNRGNFHRGHVDILRTTIHDVNLEIDPNHNRDGKCIECAVYKEFFSIFAYDASQGE